MNPTKQTQADKIKADLLKGRAVDSVMAFEQHHITRLASIIERLRKRGWPVITTTEQGSNLARYSLPDHWRPEPEAQTDTHKKAR